MFRAAVLALALGAGEAAAPPCRSTSIPFGCTPESRQTKCVDIVSYFQIDADASPTFVDYTDDAPRAQLNDVTFLFSSDANRELFETDPWKYAPKYGGF